MIWHCRPDRIECPAGHALLPRTTRIRMGHLTVVCRRCEPAVFGFGVVAVAPTPLVTLYSITEAQLEAMNEIPGDLSTLEILSIFGYADRRIA